MRATLAGLIAYALDCRRVYEAALREQKPDRVIQEALGAYDAAVFDVGLWVMAHQDRVHEKDDSSQSQS